MGVKKNAIGVTERIYEIQEMRQYLPGPPEEVVKTVLQQTERLCANLSDPESIKRFRHATRISPMLVRACSVRESKTSTPEGTGLLTRNPARSRESESFARNCGGRVLSAGE